MIRSYREFEAGPDPFGNTWKVAFLWLQTGIAIRHADTVDVKFVLDGAGGRSEKVIALPHPALLELARVGDRPLSDAWCGRLAAAHLRHMIETSEDMEKLLVTLSGAQLRRAAATLDEVVAGR